MKKQTNDILFQYMSELVNSMPNGLNINTFSNCVAYIDNIIKTIEDHKKILLTPSTKLEVINNKLIMTVEFNTKDHDGFFTYEKK